MTVVLEGMSPAQEQGWLVLLDLFPNRRTAEHDGPHAYGAFLLEEGDEDAVARLRQEAVAVVRQFLQAM